MTKTRRAIITVCLGIVLICIFLPRSVIYLRHEDINIKTGQCRITHVICFVQMSQQIKDTFLSLTLRGKKVDVADIKEWHRVNTSCPGTQIASLYRFRGAFWQAEELESILEIHNASETHRKDPVIRLLSIWQQSGNYDEGEEFLTKLRKNLEQADPLRRPKGRS